MGTCIRPMPQQCTRLFSPPPSWPSPLLTAQLQPTPPPQLTLQLPLTTSPPHTRRRNSPLSHSPTSTELLMTTARPTSRSPRPKTEMVSSPDLSLMSPTREPQSTHQSQRRDTDTPPPTLLPLQLTSPPQLTSQLPKMLGGS